MITQERMREIRDVLKNDVTPAQFLSLILDSERCTDCGNQKRPDVQHQCSDESVEEEEP